MIPKLAIFVLFIRIFYLSFFEYALKWRYYIVIIGVVTVVVGSFGGLEQKKLKSLLAYSSISHMGYTLVAFSTGTFEGMQILFCYLFLYMFAGLCIWSIFLVLQLKNKFQMLALFIPPNTSFGLALLIVPIELVLYFFRYLKYQFITLINKVLLNVLSYFTRK